MSGSTSPTVTEILAELGVTTLAGEIIIGGVRGLSTTVGVAAKIQNLMVIDTGATSATTATVTLTSASTPLTIGSGTEGSVETSGDGRTLTFSGTLDQVNADLGLLSYLSGSAGSDTVTVTATDIAGNTKSASFGVSVLGSSAARGDPTKAVYVQSTSVGQSATLSGGNQIYAASDETDSVTASGTASTVTGGATGSVLTLVQDGGSYQYSNGGGAATIVANSAAGTISGGAAGSTLVAFLNDQTTSYVGGFGNDEIIGGSGAMTVTGGQGGSLTVFGGAGTLDFQGGDFHGSQAKETVVGGTGAATIHAAASGGAYFGGSGGSQMFAAGAGTFLIGAVSGDVLTASAFGGDELVAGAGNETLNGGGSRWENVMFGGSGSDTVMLGAGQDTYVGGSGAATIQMGSGSAALFAGTGAEVFNFTASLTNPSSSLGTGVPGSDMISGFRVGVDHLQLSGGLAVTGYASGSGMTSLQLSDGTQIHLAGVSGVSQASLFG